MWGTKRRITANSPQSDALGTPINNQSESSIQNHTAKAIGTSISREKYIIATAIAVVIKLLNASPKRAVCRLADPTAI
jgi:hypothetical protein